MMGRPRAATKAYRVVAAPFDGWLWNDEWWSVQEWEQQEQLRAKDRERKARLSAGIPIACGVL